jgi:hypothetical protein
MHGGAWWQINLLYSHPITDWAPSLPSVLPSIYVTIHVQAAEDQHYYKPAEPAYASSGLSTLLIRSIKRSALPIPFLIALDIH